MSTPFTRLDSRLLRQRAALVIVLVLGTLSTFGHGTSHMPTTVATNCPTVANLTPFLDALPLAGTAVPARTNRLYCIPEVPSLCFTNVPEYDMVMYETNHIFHTNLVAVPIWGYQGQYPGPTIEAEVNQPVLVNWINRLPTYYTNWNSPSAEPTLVRNVVHLHGGAVLPRYDGYPTNVIYPGQRDQYFYQNLDFGGDGETLWYHDHANMVTGNNVYAGLAGYYLLRDKAREAGLGLPNGKYEVALLLQDKDIQTNCSPATLVYNGVEPLHSLAVINGKVTPYLDVDPALYRFRLLNGSTYRTWQPVLARTDIRGIPLGGSQTNVPLFSILGTEDGFLPNRVDTATLALMPGERYDLLLDFRQFAGQILTMTNGPGGGVSQVTFTNFIGNMMQFRVAAGTPVPSAEVPTQLLTNFVATSTLVATSKVSREFTLDLRNELPFPGPPFTPLPPPGATNDPNPGPFALIDLLPFEADISTFPVAGEVETWSIINLTSEAHPFHVHLLDFRVAGRTRFAGFPPNQPPPSSRTNPPTGVISYIRDRAAGMLKPLTNYLTATTAPPAPWESGDKDTVRAAPYSVTTIVMTWPTNAFFHDTPSAMNPVPGEDTDGRYIYHCHILQHEDNDMMRPLQLLVPSAPDALSIRRVGPADPAMAGPVRLRFRSHSNMIHQLIASPHLDVPARLWQVVPGTRVPGHGGLLELTLPSAHQPAQFYDLLTTPAADEN